MCTLVRRQRNFITIVTNVLTHAHTYRYTQTDRQTHTHTHTHTHIHTHVIIMMMTERVLKTIETNLSVSDAGGYKFTM